MMRRTCALALLVCGFGWAQQPPPHQAQERALVRRLLSSSDPRDLAWGAHLAGNYQDKATRDELIRLADHADNIVRMHALDGLIRLEFAVEREHLERWFKEWPVQTLILSTRLDSGRPDFYERLVQTEPPSMAWAAALNLLAESNRRLAASHALSGLTFHVILHVVDSPNMGDGAGGGVGGGNLCRMASEGGVYPPSVDYTLSLDASTGATLLADGPSAAYYRRQRTDPAPSPVVDPSRYGHRMLAWLLDVKEAEMPLRPVMQETVATGALNQRIDTTKRGLALGYARLIQKLLAAGLWDASTAPPPLTVTIEVDDLRTDRTVPLPPVERQFTLLPNS